MEIKDILEKNDFSLILKTNQRIGRKLTSAEIVNAIQENGYPLPTKTVRFTIIDKDDNVYWVQYIVNIGYSWIKVKIA